MRNTHVMVDDPDHGIRPCEGQCVSSGAQECPDDRFRSIGAYHAEELLHLLILLKLLGIVSMIALQREIEHLPR
jgi:hypothetical protein